MNFSNINKILVICTIICVVPIITSCQTLSGIEHIRNTNQTLYTWLDATEAEISTVYGEPTETIGNTLRYRVYYEDREKSRTITEKDTINGIEFTREREEYYTVPVYCDLFFVLENGRVKEIQIDSTRDEASYRVDCYDPEISEKNLRGKE